MTGGDDDAPRTLVAALTSVGAHAWSANRATRREQHLLEVLDPSPEISVSGPGQRP